MWRLSPLFYWAQQPSYSIKTCRHSTKKKRKKREIGNRATFKLAAGASSWLYNQGLIRGGTVSFSFLSISSLNCWFSFFFFHGSIRVSIFFFFKRSPPVFKDASLIKEAFLIRPSSLLLEMPQHFFPPLSSGAALLYIYTTLPTSSAAASSLGIHGWFMIYDGHSLFFFFFFSFLRQLFLTRIFSGHKYKISELTDRRRNFSDRLACDVKSHQHQVTSQQTTMQLSPRKSINLGIDVSFSLRLWSINWNCSRATAICCAQLGKKKSQPATASGIPSFSVSKRKRIAATPDRLLLLLLRFPNVHRATDIPNGRQIREKG